jgi:hypothetical protein
LRELIWLASAVTSRVRKVEAGNAGRTDVIWTGGWPNVSRGIPNLGLPHPCRAFCDRVGQPPPTCWELRKEDRG